MRTDENLCESQWPGVSAGDKAADPSKEPSEMEPIALVAIAVVVLGIGIAAVSVNAFKVSNEEYERTGKRAKGYYLGIGMAIGIPLGIPFGLALGNIALGPALGLPFGVAIGAALERRNASSLRPLTAREAEARRKALTYAAILLGVVAAVALAVFLLVQ